MHLELELPAAACGRVRAQPQAPLPVDAAAPPSPDLLLFAHCYMPFSCSVRPGGDPGTQRRSHRPTICSLPLSHVCIFTCCVRPG